MINFRFHLVSLVAVFLALALGVVVGSTLVDRAIVDGLRDRIDEVEANADEQAARNAELVREIELAKDYAKAALPHMVAGRLRDVNVSVVALRGINDGAVRDVTDTLRAAGAVVPGVLWLEPSFGSTEAKVQAKLAHAVTDPYRRGAELRQAALEALGRRLALGPLAPTSAAPPLEGSKDLLVSLGEARFVAFEQMGGVDVDLATWPPPATRLVVIDGTEAKMPAEIVTLPLVRGAVLAGTPAAVAEVFNPSEAEKDGEQKSNRGDKVAVVRKDGDLGSKVATVDDVEEPPGRVALAFAVEELGLGRAGHYGSASGASKQIPDLVLNPALPTQTVVGAGK
jgi:hypothetical protein